VTGSIAVVGPVYQEQAVAEAALRRVQATGANATIVPVTALPQLGFKTGMLVVATGFTSQAAAQQFCATLPSELQPCQPVNASG
jgi:hypothetical protein